MWIDKTTVLKSIIDVSNVNNYIHFQNALITKQLQYIYKLTG